MPDFGSAPAPASGNEFPAALTPIHPDWFGSLYVITAAAQPHSGGNNVVHYVPFKVHKTVTIKRIAWLNGGTVNGTIEVGIYSEAGVRQVTSGAVTQTGTNAIQVSNIADTTLTPGLYYFAYVVSSTTGTYFMGSVAPNFTTIGVAHAANAIGLLKEAIASLPATWTPVVVTDSGLDTTIIYASLYRTAA